MLLLTVFFYGCSSTDNVPPAWITNAESQYPASQYITAVGEASTKENASNLALVNLAKIFSVDIKSTSSDLTQAISQQSDAGSFVESTQKISRSIVTKTDIELQGAMIKETWQQPQKNNNGHYFALALLNKNLAAKRLILAIRSADQDTANLLAYSANKAPNLVLALHALRNARDVQIKRELDHQQLLIVTDKGIINKIGVKDIEAMMRDALATLKIASVAESSSSKALLQSGLGEIGIQSVKDSNLILKANLELLDPANIQGWYWLRGSYELSISDGDNVISQKRWTVKISAKDEEMLMPRMKDHINKKVSGYLIELLSTKPTKL